MLDPFAVAAVTLALWVPATAIAEVAVAVDVPVDFPVQVATDEPPNENDDVADARPKDPVNDWILRWRERWPHGRIAIGYSYSGVDLADDTDGAKSALILRVMGRHGIGIELEVASTRFSRPSSCSLRCGDYTVKAGGGALVKAFDPFGMGMLAPYVIAGIGIGTLDRLIVGPDAIERSDGPELRLRYAELGGGLMLQRFWFGMGLDVRRGVQRVDPGGDSNLAARSETPAGSDDNKGGIYTRVGILMLFMF